MYLLTCIPAITSCDLPMSVTIGPTICTTIQSEKIFHRFFPRKLHNGWEVTDVYFWYHFASKLIPGLRDRRCEERLKECGLTTLETCRLRGDHVGVFKILNGYENIDCNIFFKIKEGKITRGLNYTLVKKQSRLDVRKYSFCQRTINVWNKLSTDCMHASSVNMFNNKIDKYLVTKGGLHLVWGRLHLE